MAAPEVKKNGNAPSNSVTPVAVASATRRAPQRKVAGEMVGVLIPFEVRGFLRVCAQHKGFNAGDIGAFLALPEVVKAVQAATGISDADLRSRISGDKPAAKRAPELKGPLADLFAK